MTYEHLPYESMEETLREVGSGDPGRVVRAVLGASLESPDRAWVEACAVSLTNAADNEVRRAAVMAMGHLARRFRLVSPAAVAAVIGRAGHDDAIAGAAEELRDDLETLGMAP
jgi:hypothetical protein